MKREEVLIKKKIKSENKNNVSLLAHAKLIKEEMGI
jgi:hypothetical protein